MDSIFLLFTEWKWRGREGERLVEDRLPQRFRAHYAPVLEALPTFERSYRSEFGDDLRPRSADGSAEANANVEKSAGRQVTEAVEKRLSVVTRWRRLKNHLLPVGALVLWLWSLLYPALEEIVDTDRFEWSVFFGELGSALFDAVNPFQLFGLIFVVLFLYGIGAVVLWCRVAQAVEDATTEVEAAYRKDVEGLISRLGERLRAALAEWENDKRALEEIADGLGDDR